MTLQEELDMKVLVFQNKKFSERIEQRKKVENELRKRIEQLENRQRTDDAVLMIVNRYWNQVCRNYCMHFHVHKSSCMHTHRFFHIYRFSHGSESIFK